MHPPDHNSSWTDGRVRDLPPSVDAGFLALPGDVPAATVLGVPSDRLVQLRQIHSSVVHVVDGPHQADGDALVTAEVGLTLVVRLADCAGILVYDGDHGVVAAVHSGWRGTAAGILGATVAAMRDRFGTDPGRCSAWIVPCASGERYVVRSDVAHLFPEAIERIGDDRWLFDNRRELLRQARELGFNERDIVVDPRCTIGDPTLHSYRRDGASAGRNIAWIRRLG